MKSVRKSLILILTTLPLMLAFQNCQKKKGDEPSQYEDCRAAGGGDECLLVEKNGFPVSTPNPAKTEISINSFSPTSYFQNVYSINVTSNRALNTKTNVSCSLNNNVNWKTIKDLYLERGICEYRYYLPPDSVRCMAMSIPIAFVKDTDAPQEIAISGSICQQDHFTVCGFENQEAFHKAISDLGKELDAGQGCD